MTIATTAHTFDYSGNGTTTIFAVPFPFKAQSHLVITLIDNATSAVTAWTLGVDYTLTGGDPTGTLTAVVAPASGKTLHGERVVPVLQSLDLNANDGFPASAMEDALDLLTMMIQQGLSGGGSAPAYTIANIGTGQGVSAGLVGTQYQLKGLKVSGTGLSIASDADSITTTLSGVLIAASNLGDVANRQTALNTLTAVGAATNEFVLTKDTGTGNAIWKVVPTGGGGEANTSSNAGGTVGLALAKVGVNLPFRGLTAGANVTLTPSGTDVTIAATGEANTISSAAATGLTLVNGKTGVDLRVKGLGVTAPLSLSATATDLTAALDLTAAITWTGIHQFNSGAAVNLSSLDYGLGGTIDAARMRLSRTTDGSRSDSKVQSALVASTRINTPSTGGVNYAEWTALFNMEDRTDNGVHATAVYAKALKYGTSAIFGGVFQVDNPGGSSSGNMHGVEIDLQSDGTSIVTRRVGLGIYYGSSGVGGAKPSDAGATTKQLAAMFIAPFRDGRNQLAYGLSFSGGDIDETIAMSSRGLNAFSAYGSYSDAILNLDGVSSSPVAIDMGPGSRLKFRSGTGNGGNTTWWPVITTYTPTWAGAVEILIDGVARYFPVATAHPT